MYGFGKNQKTLKSANPNEDYYISHRSKKDFVYNNQYFSLDHIYSPINLWLLEIELIDKDDPVELPPFLNIDKEVTGVRGYSNYDIACS